jgi:tRNA pseudouridine55 synthase
MTHRYGNHSADDFRDGQILLVDKPLGWTSFDAVKKIRLAIRKKFGLKKLKVGHAGTLDPLATGLLIICTGKFTKKIAELTLEDKGYSGTFELGSTTPSYDLETERENHKPADHITDEMVRDAAKTLTGAIMQRPPIFSAKKVEGKRAYLSARKGRDLKLDPKPVVISRFETHTEVPVVTFNIDCSKGTYIRALARDLGEILGCGAHLTSLRRTRIGAYRVEDAIEPEEFVAQLSAEDEKP